MPLQLSDLPALPDRFAVLGNYPNPFNPVTTIQFDLPVQAEVRVEVYNVLGQLVLATPARVIEAGSARSLQLDAAELGSGIYFYRVLATGAGESMIGSGRMVMVK